MTLVARTRWSVVGLCGRFSFLLLSAFCLLGCSVPNLEDADCTQARDIVREFYSFHFANDMHPTAENVRLREKYLTQDYESRLLSDSGGASGTKDYFTDAQDFPKAFRVGECRIIEPGKRARFQVLMFWKDDVKSEQKPVFATIKKENDVWLIDDVTPLDK